MSNKPTIEYKVVYEQNPEYDGEFQIPIIHGLQGTFCLLADAHKAAKKCKDWFNQEKSLVKSIGKDGKPEEVEHIEHHDNVLVVIETWKNGAKESEAIWEGEEKAKKKKELAIA